jgi:hypothetical protein
MGFWCSWWILRGEGIEEEGMGKEDIKDGSLCPSPLGCFYWLLFREPFEEKKSIVFFVVSCNVNLMEGIS